MQSDGPYSRTFGTAHSMTQCLVSVGGIVQNTWNCKQFLLKITTSSVKNTKSHIVHCTT